MATITPRASRLWSDSVRMSYFDAELEGDAEGDMGSCGEMLDGRTPLDRTIDRIGMGSYQWILLSLCGFGWMADNMWLEAIAIILPRVQWHFIVSDRMIGLLPSFMQAGMMFGAVGWGACSDLMGRTSAFNATLVLTAVFGIIASLSTSFPVLCGTLFFLGSAVGGSMPTDGTLLLEYIPRRKQYLVTALSVFFSFGAVLAAVIGLMVIPSHSCSSSEDTCSRAENLGWKYLLSILAAITIIMFVARILFFRLYESPRYLVHAGRHEEALESLQLISRFNGRELPLQLSDVADDMPSPRVGETAPFLPATPADPGFVKQDDQGEDASENLESPEDPHTRRPGQRTRMASDTGLFEGAETKTYGSQDVSPAGEGLNPLERVASPDAETGDGQLSPTTAHAQATSSRLQRPSTRRRSVLSTTSRRSSFYEAERKIYLALPRAVRKPLQAWLDRMALVLAPEWRRTTILVWCAWFSMALAYTMFNVFLPKLLESGSSGGGAPKSIEESLWDVVIFTLGGCPGALVGAWMVESPLGRRRSLAGSTFATALACVAFVTVRGEWAVRASTMLLSLSATTMWAILYGWTPEIFGTEVRGTACGVASALSRIGGMFAPLLGGTLLSIDRAFPVYASIVVFCLAGIAVVLLKEDSSRTKEDGVHTALH